MKYVNLDMYWKIVFQIKLTHQNNEFNWWKVWHLNCLGETVLAASEGGDNCSVNKWSSLAINITWTMHENSCCSYSDSPHLQEDLPELCSHFHQWMEMATLRSHTTGIKIICFKLPVFPGATETKQKLFERQKNSIAESEKLGQFIYLHIQYIALHTYIYTYAAIISAVRSVSCLVTVVLKELPLTIQYDFTVLSR